MYRAILQARGFAAAGTAPAKYNPQPTSMDVEFTQLSDLGKVRTGNEDYLGHVQPVTPEDATARGWLFVLADGVGGHEHGEVASKTAVETMLAGFRKAASGEAHTGLLKSLVQTANARVLDAGHASIGGGSSFMATTIVACALRFDRVAVAHVGDSRCYLIRRGEANLLTRDHTVANEQVRLKLISAEEAAESEARHMLSRSLGSGIAVNVEVNEHQVFAGDVLVLCSDGLHGSVSGSEIAALTSQGADLNRAARRLVEIANDRDGSDNISLQIIRVKSVERVGMYRGRPYRIP
jgi:serine/threonine protein phosphatase PrpC